MTGDTMPALVRDLMFCSWHANSVSVWVSDRQGKCLISVMKNIHPAKNHQTSTHFGQITRTQSRKMQYHLMQPEYTLIWDDGSNINFKVYVKEIFLSSLDCPGFSLCQASLVLGAGLYSCNGYTSQGAQRILTARGWVWQFLQASNVSIMGCWLLKGG